MTPQLAQGTHRVREAATLAQVVSQYVQLRPAGAGRLAGLCPFHEEKSPSFTVAVNKNLWHCFGCSSGGDVFSFVQRIEGVTFLEARRALAEQHGVTLDDRPLTRMELATQQRQRAYAEQFAADAAIYWQHVRRRCEGRFQTLMAIAVGASDRGMEDAYQEYARRAWRWGKILRRLDAMEPAALLRAFGRVRSRRNVAALVATYHDADRAAKGTWGRVIAAAAAGQVTAEQCCRIAAAVYAGPERAREVLG